MREAHTLKGSARMVGLTEFGEVAHKLEDILSKIKKGAVKPIQDVKDILLKGTQILKRNLSGVNESELAEFLEKANKFLGSETKPVEKTSEKKKPEKKLRDAAGKGSFELKKVASSRKEKRTQFLKLPIEEQLNKYKIDYIVCDHNKEKEIY